MSATRRAQLTVDEHMEAIRQSLGVSRERFANLTMREVREAEARLTWCAVHGAVREKSCGWCVHLARSER